MLERSMGLEPVLSAIALVSGLGRVGTCSQRWQAGADFERGWRFLSCTAKCNLVYASQKLKYDPALLKQFSFEKLYILPTAVQL